MKSTDPVRWVDDPAFEAETGCRLDALDALYTGYDLERIRTRALDRPVAPRPRWPWGVGGAVVVAALWLGSLSAPPSPPPVADPMTDAPALPALPLQPPLVIHAPALREEIPTDAPPAARARRSAPSTPAETAPSAPAAALTATPPVSPDAPIAAPDALIAEPPDRLARENAAIGEAQAWLAEGQPERALAGFEDYLAAWPAGRMRVEAELGRLTCLHALSRSEALAALAAHLLTLPALAGHTERILSLQVHALAELQRCDEALRAAEGLPKRTQSEIRRACRG